MSDTFIMINKDDWDKFNDSYIQAAMQTITLPFVEVKVGDKIKERIQRYPISVRLHVMQAMVEQREIDEFMHDIVNRFEVIDENGRSYSKHNIKIDLSYQDEGKTLKVFVKK